MLFVYLAVLISSAHALLFSFTGSHHLYECTPCKCASRNGPRLTNCRPMWTYDPSSKYKLNGLCLVADDGMYMFTSPGETCPEGSPQPPVPQDPNRVFGGRSFMMSECRSNTQYHSEIVRNNKGTNTQDKCAGWCDRQLWNGDQANACQFSAKYHDKHCKAIWSDVTYALGAELSGGQYISCSDGQSYLNGWKCQWGSTLTEQRDNRQKVTEDKCREMANNKAYTWYSGNGQCYTYPNGITTGTRASTGQWNTNSNRDWVTCRFSGSNEANDALNRAFRQGMGVGNSEEAVAGLTAEEYCDKTGGIWEAGRGCNYGRAATAMVESSTSVTLEHVALYGFAAFGFGFVLYGAGKHFSSKAGDTVYAQV